MKYYHLLLPAKSELLPTHPIGKEYQLQAAKDENVTYKTPENFKRNRWTVMVLLSQLITGADCGLPWEAVLMQ